MTEDFICDPETGKVVAIIRGGEVFRDNIEGTRIAILIGANLYDLKGNLVGHLQGRNVTAATGQTMTIPFRELLEGNP